MRIPFGVVVIVALVTCPVEALDARPTGAATSLGEQGSVKIAQRARGGVKATGQRVCGRRGDLRVPLRYLHGGSVWIPAEARCGGRFPVIVLLHGNNQARETVKSIGGGRNLDEWARRYLNGQLIEPVVLAEPIHFGACANDERRAGLPFLFSGAFDFKEYRRRLEAVLRKEGVRASSWSFIGHSGAACCLRMGMFALKEAWPEIKVWGSADGCYSEKAQAPAIQQQFEGSQTRVFNACRGYPAYQGYRGYERALLTREAVGVKCDGTYYKQCRRHPTQPWFSFTTHFTGPEKHSKVLEELFKTIVFHEFPSERRLAYQRAQATRQARLAAARREQQARLAATRREQQAKLAATRRDRRERREQQGAGGEARAQGARQVSRGKPSGSAGRVGSLAAREE